MKNSAASVQNFSFRLYARFYIRKRQSCRRTSFWSPIEPSLSEAWNTFARIAVPLPHGTSYIWSGSVSRTFSFRLKRGTYIASQWLICKGKEKKKTKMRGSDEISLNILLKSII